jgi:two-component system, OmpR family, sensor kinase
MIYTGMIAIVLIVPLVTYVVLLLQIDEAKVKLSLESQAKRIIVSMQRYKNEEKVYRFPRYKEYTAALYDEQFRAIFSTLAFTPHETTEGFHQQGSHFYFVYPFADDYYFGAHYLLVEKSHTADKIYFFAFAVMAAIIVTLFVFSLMLLKNFSEPFEALNQQLDNFIKDSVHEINTPLSIINLNVDLFANKFGQNKYLWRIKAASRTLATIYSDMDYLVKQGRVQYSIKPIDIGEFVQNRVDYFREVANLKEVTLDTKIDQDAIYLFSATKLQRIVDNTLSNAIKYSHDRGTIRVAVRRSESSIEFSVEDEGIGIDNVDRIFSRYYRENEAKGGFGIGLNIVKQIVDEEQIGLQVRSKLGEGTTFCYTFYIKDN